MIAPSVYSRLMVALLEAIAPDGVPAPEGEEGDGDDDVDEVSHGVLPADEIEDGCMAVPAKQRPCQAAGRLGPTRYVFPPAPMVAGCTAEQGRVLRLAGSPASKDRSGKACLVAQEMLLAKARSWRRPCSQSTNGSNACPEPEMEIVATADR